jgi:two-component system, NtrC family, response regulator
MLTGKILIIDDEEKLRTLLQRIISLEGFSVLTAATLKAASKLLEKEEVDVVLCDVKLPDGNGVDFIPLLKSKFPDIEIIMLTAYGNIPDGVKSIQAGAFDYITKGDDNKKIIPLINRAIEKIRLQKRVQQLENQVGRQYTFDNIIGKSAAIKEAIVLAQQVSDTDATVLLLGETGTGKEVFAQAIHQASTRKKYSFVAVNCSSLSRELLESEIFGYKAGAFTGAVKDKKGLLEEAHYGTLFLDEIGEMPLELQARLLRVLETNEFTKIGKTTPDKVNIRLITATNRDLLEEVKEGKFREDLYYRLNVFTIKLPPLRERKKDIPLLAQHFLEIFADKTNRKIKSMDASFAEQLQKHDWHGNTRELKNIMERAVILASGNTLTIETLPFELQHHQTRPTSQLSAFDLASMEKLHIQRVLNHTHGNKAEAARLLNIGLTTLYRKIEEYQIEVL